MKSLLLTPHLLLHNVCLLLILTLFGKSSIQFCMDHISKCSDWRSSEYVLNPNVVRWLSGYTGV